MNNSRICCFTGHRDIPHDEADQLVANVRQTIRSLAGEGILTFRAGGARGFDTLAALCVLELRDELGLRLELFLPCRDQTRGWSYRDKDYYNHILSSCDFVHYVSDTYSSQCMLERNRQMVNGSEVCVSYCRRSHGGTVFTVMYALRQGLRLVEL